MKIKDEIQGYYADCYVLTEKRNYDFIISILNHFVPNRRETADEYEISQYSENPTELFDNADEMIRFLSKNKRIKHTLYWENPDKTELKGVELFFTDDEYLICGVYCDTKFPNTEIEDKYFEELKKICNSKQGYITYEEPSVHNSQEFIEITKKWNLNNRNEEDKQYLLKNKNGFKRVIKGTFLSILIFFSISFLTILFQINSPLNRIKENYELRIGFPFEYYHEFMVDCPIPNSEWNVNNLILNIGIIWFITIGIMMLIKNESTTINKNNNG